MLKQLASLSLLLCFAMQIFCQAAIVGSYYVNTGAFSKNCVNRMRPQLHCNGKCQLLKKLKQEEKKETQNPEGRGNIKNQVLSSRSYFASLQLIRTGEIKMYGHFLLSFPTDRSLAIFHPPGA